MSSTARSEGILRVDDMWKAWHTFRMGVAVAAMVFGVVLGVAWGWPAGFVTAALAGVPFLDAVRRRPMPAGSPWPSLLLDITLIGVAMVVTGLDPAGVGAPALHMVAVPIVLLPWRKALPTIAYAAVWTVGVLIGWSSVEPPVDFPSWVVTGSAYVLFGASTVALLGIVLYQLERSYRRGARRLRYEHALATCGNALLASADEAAIDVALQALLDATPAQEVFIDENADDPVLGLSGSVTHEVISPGFEHVVDEEIWSDDAESRQVVRTVVPYAELPTLRAALSRGDAAVMRTSELSGREREIYGEDGCLSELNLPILVDGSWVGSLGLVDYVSDRKWNDDDVAVLQTAAAMIGSFWERARAMERLEELVRSKDRFLASISHEIRTPLTAVVGFSQVLRDDAVGLSPGGSEMVEIVAQQAQEISDIVEDLLVAARADIDALAIASEDVVLRGEAERVASARKALNIAIEESGVAAVGDPIRIRQIIRCLVSNAARYGGECIEIRIRRDGDRALLTVADSGSGVTAGHERHIFDAFHRAGTSDTTKAIGLGLYVSHHLAGLMGGNLTYRRAGGWTLFELDLPGVAEQTVDPSLASLIDSAETGQAPTPDGPLVPSA